MDYRCLLIKLKALSVPLDQRTFILIVKYILISRYRNLYPYPIAGYELFIRKDNMETNKSELKPSKMKQVYSREDIKDWISFGIKNDYVNKVKKDQVAKWVDLILKHGVVKMNDKLMLDEDNADLKE